MMPAPPSLMMLLLLEEIMGVLKSLTKVTTVRKSDIMVPESPGLITMGLREYLSDLKLLGLSFPVKIWWPYMVVLMALKCLVYPLVWQWIDLAVDRSNTLVSTSFKIVIDVTDRIEMDNDH